MADSRTQLSLTATPGRRYSFGVSVAPAAVAVAWAVVAPAVTIAVSATPVSASWSTPAPTLVNALAVSPVGSTWSPVTPGTALRHGSTPLVASWSVVAPGLSLTQSPAALPASWATVAPTLVNALAVSPAIASWAVVTPQAAIAAVASPLSVTWSVPTPAAALSVSVAPVTVTWTIPPLVFGTTASTSPVAVVWSVVAPTLLNTLAVSPVTATWTPLTPGLSAPTFAPAPLVLTWSVVIPTVVYSVIPPPQNNDYTVLMLHADRPVGTTDIIDDAAGGSDSKTITAIGDTKIERTPKFDYGAIAMAGNGSLLKIDPSNDWGFGIGDFTIDFHVKTRDVGRAHYLTIGADIGGEPDPDNRLSIELVNHQGGYAQFALRYRVDGQDFIHAVSQGSVLIPVAETYVHVAIVRYGELWTLHLGGTQYAQAVEGEGQSWDFVLPIDADLSAWTMYLGGSFRSDGVGGFLTADALFDEFRIQKGVAVWQSDFIPPTEQYTRRFAGGLSATFKTYVRHESVTRGTHNAVATRFTQELRGASHLRNQANTELSGTTHVYNPFTTEIRSRTNVIKRTYRGLLSGAALVRNAYDAAVSGVGRVLTERFTTEIGGSHTKRERFEGAVSGAGRVLETFEAELGGVHRTEDTTTDRFELYHALDAMPVITDPPLATSATLPMVSPAISGEGKHYLLLLRRNRFGVVSGNRTATIIELDGSDNQITVAPSPPEMVTAIAVEGDKLKITAEYVYPADGELQGDGFAIYRKVGIFGSMDFVTTVSMIKTDGIARLEWESTETFAGRNPVDVEVRVRRSSDGRESDAIGGSVNFLLAVPLDPPEGFEAYPI